MEEGEPVEERRRSADGERRARTISYVLESGKRESRSKTIAEQMMSNMSLRLDHVFGAQPSTPVLVERVKEHLIIAYATASGVVVLQTPADAPFGDFTKTDNLLLRKHNEAIVAMALCPVTGSHLVTCGKDASYVWDIRAAFEGDPNTPVTPLYTLAGSFVDDAHPNCLSFWVDPNSDKSRWYLITGNHDGNMRIYRAHHNYSLFHDITCHQSAILSIDVHPGAQKVTTGATDGTVRVWNLCMDQPADEEKRGGSAPEEDLIVSSTADNYSDNSDEEQEGNVYDDSLISLVGSFAAHRGDVSAVAFAPDGRTSGRFIISGGRDNMLQVSDVETQQIMGELGKKDEDSNPQEYRHQGSIREIKTMRIEQKTGEDVAALFQAVSCSTDGTVRTWIVQAKFSAPEEAAAGGDSVSADGSFKVGKEELSFLQDPVGDALSETILGTLFDSGSDKTETAQLVSSVEAILAGGKKLKDNQSREENAAVGELEVVSKRVEVKSKLLYRNTVGMLNKYGVFDLDFCILPPLNNGSENPPPRIVVACSSTRSLVRFFTGLSKYPDLSPEGSADDIYQALKDGPVFQSSNHTNSVSAMRRVDTEIVVPVPQGYSRARRPSTQSTFRGVASACRDGSFCISSPADTPLLDSRGCGWIDSAIREVCTYSPGNGSSSAGTTLSDIIGFAGSRNGMVYRLGYSETPDREQEQDAETPNASTESEKNYWKTKLSFPAHVVDVSALAFEPHMKLLATAGADLSLSIWEVLQEEVTSNPKPIVNLPGAHDGIITALTFFVSSGDPTKSCHMASGATDGKVFCWKLMRLSATKIELQKVWSSADYYENGGITSLEFGTGVSRGSLVSSSWGGTMRVWDCLKVEGSSRNLGNGAPSAYPKHSWESVRMRIGAISLSPNGAMVACACSSGLIRVYDMTDYSLLCSQNILHGRIYSSSLEHISWPQDDVIVVGTSYGELLRLVLVFGETAVKAEENLTTGMESRGEEVEPLDKTKAGKYSVENLLQFTGVPGVTVDDLAQAQAQDSGKTKAKPEPTTDAEPPTSKNKAVSNPLSSLEFADTIDSVYETAVQQSDNQQPERKPPSSAGKDSARQPTHPKGAGSRRDVPVVTENPAAGTADSEAPQRRQKQRPSNTASGGMKVALKKTDPHSNKNTETVERGNPIRHAQQAASYREIYGSDTNATKNSEKSPSAQPPVHEKQELLEPKREVDESSDISEQKSPTKTANEGDEELEKSEFQPLMSRKKG
eukprot:gb/GECG01006609.1/.p1 GENE.gb/GECG01006609.1/~~gb/GECG01006609.1/.p1  ORF type:complete len:1245 (+),score=182.74 gb/GECG01006609.1/:1-3735(+)